MTAPGRSRKRYIRSCAGAILSLALGLALAGGGSSAVRAGTTERIVVDRHTGLALYGIDPVAYFTKRMPVAGRAELELRFAGAIWRFDNEGNRAAFAKDPYVYMPRFGGYDPLGIARGVSTPGYPQLWSLHGDRLYLFYTAAARQTFLADPGSAIAAAEARWPDVMKDLAE